MIFCLNNVFSQEKALFIGNSMTYFNNMPNLFQELANSKGKNVQSQYYAPGGTGFVNHVNDANVYNLFESEVWDYVVLQPGTAESAGVSWPINTTIERGQKLVDSIKKYSPCAKIFLYEIPYGIKATNNVPDYNDYFAIQTIIKDSITKLANGLNVPIVPAGECARNHFINQQDLLLHNSYNDVHPNLNGSYLVACAMFSAIFQEQLFSSNFLGGVSQQNADYFQNIADNIVLPNREEWLLNEFTLHSEFDYVLNGLEIQLNNLSTNFISLNWNINNEFFSTDDSPSFTFDSPGLKTISLTTFDGICYGTFELIINVELLNNPSFNSYDIELFPNPTSDFLNIKFKFKGDEEVYIFDLNGKFLIQNTFIEDNKINVSSLTSGIYYLLIKRYNEIIFKEFVKKS